MISVETWPVQQFEQNKNQGTLLISPEYQRRPVWAPKDQMLLADSIARGVPVGAITLYANTDKGYEVYEVIDGKQRLSAILNFLSDGLEIKTKLIAAAAIEDDEFNEGDEVTKSFHGKKFCDLDVPSKMRIHQYKIPLFVVRGERSDAIRAFTRMNRSSYSLTPQEIRNAFYADTQFLNTVIEQIEKLDLEGGGSDSSPADSLLVKMGAVSKSSWDRMQDLQLLSELLILCLHGVQHRRDSLDEFYSLYKSPSAASTAKLDGAASHLRSIILPLWEIADETTLQALHFPGACEHDVYGLVGALDARGTLTAPQMKQLKEELRTVISGFRGQVEQFIAKIRSGEQASIDEFGELVEKYARGFLGGQVNSKQRREDRIQVWKTIVNGVADTLDPKSSYSDTQRRLIWVSSEDKMCARCGDVVAWEDYHAGHIVAWSNGGKTTVENGRVEHAKCNQSAGAN